MVRPFCINFYAFRPRYEHAFEKKFLISGWTFYVSDKLYRQQSAYLLFAREQGFQHFTIL